MRDWFLTQAGLLVLSTTASYFLIGMAAAIGCAVSFTVMALLQFLALWVTR